MRKNDKIAISIAGGTVLAAVLLAFFWPTAQKTAPTPTTVAATRGSVAPTTPTSVRPSFIAATPTTTSPTTSLTTTVTPTTTATQDPNSVGSDLARVSAAAVEGYNNGDFNEVKGLATGDFLDDLKDTSDKDFAQQAKSDRDKNGAGHVVALSDLTSKNERSATAQVQIDYEHAGSTTKLIKFAKDGDSWKIASLGN